ncbi:MAG: S-layer homology domain-containing protein [Prochloraceae cyanobacterium]
MKLLSSFKVATLATVALTTFSIRPILAQNASFPDIENNIYKTEIEEAAKMGIVEGFPDGRFRPYKAVTREQAVVMIVKAVGEVMPVDLNDKPRNFPPFIDLPTDRWSAKSVYWLQSNVFPANTAQLTGYFRPESPITRRSLVELLKWTAELISIKLRASAELIPTEEPTVFSDVYGYDKVLTMQMSAFCNVASPLNEKGTRFFPLKQANRDYVAAAIVRAVKCPEK